jgi:hypothetical protein
MADPSTPAAKDTPEPPIPELYTTRPSIELPAVGGTGRPPPVKYM